MSYLFIIELDKLIPKENEKIKLINKDVMKDSMKIEILEDTHGMSKGTQKVVRNWVGKSLIAKGIAKQVDAVLKQVIKKETFKKQTNDSNIKTKRPAKTSK